jgi:hypothetical protein
VNASPTGAPVAPIDAAVTMPDRGPRDTAATTRLPGTRTRPRASLSRPRQAPSPIASTLSAGVSSSSPPAGALAEHPTAACYVALRA